MSKQRKTVKLDDCPICGQQPFLARRSTTVALYAGALRVRQRTLGEVWGAVCHEAFQPVQMCRSRQAAVRGWNTWCREQRLKG